EMDLDTRFNVLLILVFRFHSNFKKYYDMKNIKIITVALVLILSAGSCKYLDVVPDSVATIDDAFVDRNSAEKFLATCYNYLPNFGDPWVNPGIGAGDEVWFNEEIVGS